MKDKRLDLQGLRAWAVVAVVIFHFFPSLLPYGYLGVDVFFVLSGFLITSVLAGKDALNSRTYADFYFKRVRRIFPLFLAVVAALLLYICVMHKDQKRVAYESKSAVYALLCATNLKGEDDGEDYFRMISKAKDIFTHTWSLAVEIQFYLIAPILLLFAKKWLDDFILLFLSIIASVSLIYHCVSPPMVSFNSTMSRLWQFMLGSFAFELQNCEWIKLAQADLEATSDCEDQEARTNDKVASTVILAVTFTFVIMYAGWMSAIRLIITVSATFFVQQAFQSTLLTHPMLVKIGDFSYSLYLIHWPVYCLMVEAGLVDMKEKILGISFCMVASFLVYEYYEKWYLTFTVRNTVTLVGIAYAASFVILILTPNTIISDAVIPHFSVSPDISNIAALDFFSSKVSEDVEPLDLFSLDLSEDPKMTKKGNRIDRMLKQWAMEDFRNITLDETLQINSVYEKNLDSLLTIPNCTMKRKEDNNPYGLCQAPNGNGKLKMLVLGNSYTASYGRLIMEHLRPQYSTLHFHAQHACEMIYRTLQENNQYCINGDTRFWESIDAVQPDIVLIIQRWLVPNIPIQANVSVDPIFVEMAIKLEKIEQKVFILQALPRLKNTQEAIIKRIWQNKPLDDIMEEVIELDATPMRTRLIEMAKVCKKCVLFDLYNIHLNKEKKFMVIHPHTHIQFYEQVLHHTQYGWRLIAPMFEKLNQNFNRLISTNGYPDNVLEW